jgi:hypothetical protein
MVAIALLDDHGIAAVMMIALANDFPVTTAIPIAIAMSGSYRDAYRAHANTDFSCTGRHRAANRSRGDGNHRKTLYHRMLLLLLTATQQLGRSADCSSSAKLMMC